MTYRTGPVGLADRASLGWRAVGVAGHPADHLGAERALALELAQHADAGGRHPVDQHVGRRQVELAADAGGAQVGDAARLLAHPFPAELERLDRGWLGERREECPQRLEV